MKNIQLLRIGETIFRESLNKKREEIIATIAPQLKELEEIEQQLKELDRPETPVNRVETAYKIDAPRSDKGVFLIEVKKKAFTNTEVVRLLGQEYDPALIEDKDAERMNQARFSTSLKQKVDAGKLKRVEISGRGWVYGLPYMFDKENGRLLPEFR